MLKLFERLTNWFYDRLGLERVVEFVIRHPIPPGHASRKGWMYVLGIATLTAFMLQVATGIALATKYIPSPAHAYQSLQFITNEVWLGWFLRGMHYFGASAMVLLISAHMVRVILTGSYKFPREMNWVFGVLLFVLTMAMALTGQLLRWDQNGVWTVSVASQFFGRVPLIGEQLAQFVLAGETLGGATLSRFFIFHIMVLPGMIFLCVGVHMYLVLHHGISELPEENPQVDPKTYKKWYKSYTEQGGYRYFPDAAWREAVAAVVVIGVVMLLAYIYGPKGPAEPPDPTWLPADPRPDWYLRSYYALLHYKPRGLETFIMVYLPLLIGLAMIALPFVANKGERRLKRRPWTILIVGVVIVTLAVLTELGMRAPWAMEFDTVPLTPAELPVQQPLEIEGARLYYERGCQFCHVAGDRGGQYGPDLTGLTRRLPPEAIMERTLNGIGQMPAYRGIVTVEEMNAIIAFLRSLEGER